MFNSNSLFSQEKLILIFDNKFENSIISDVKNLDKNFDLIIWIKKQLIYSKLSKIDNTWKIYNFKPEPLIFKFLESIYPGNFKQALVYYRQLMNINSEFSFLFQMLAKHFRNLLLIKSNYPKITNLSDWQITKINQQSTKFNQKTLFLAYRLFCKFDYQLKIGMVDNPHFVLSLFIHKLTVNKF
jgi:DNA polymerase III gamma/tau subunit